MKTNTIKDNILPGQKCEVFLYFSPHSRTDFKHFVSRQEKHNLGRKPHVVISHCHYCQGLVHLQSGACREDDGRLGDSRGCRVISSELIRIVIRNSRHSQFAGISHLRLLQPPNMSQFKENSHNLWRSQLL